LPCPCSGPWGRVFRQCKEAFAASTSHAANFERIIKTRGHHVLYRTARTKDESAVLIPAFISLQKPDAVMPLPLPPTLLSSTALSQHNGPALPPFSGPPFLWSRMYSHKDASKLSGERQGKRG
jgi:hypothetical protein